MLAEYTLYTILKFIYSQWKKYFILDHFVKSGDNFMTEAGLEQQNELLDKEKGTNK